MPERERNLLGIPEASYLRPLVHSLRKTSANLELLVDIPSQLAIKLQQRTESLRCAFLSPIDYARHGSDYRIVPGVSVSSSSRSNTIQLFINPDVRDVTTMAVDIRVTSEIILAKIILAEKFPNLSSRKESFKIIPMLPNREEMLQKADAALIVNFHPSGQSMQEPFSLDLVEEWNDLTDLPYVHGFWVGYDQFTPETLIDDLIREKAHGISHLDSIASALSDERSLSREMGEEYLEKFSYDLDEKEQEALSEFTRFAYYYGVLPDVPDLNFFDVTSPPSLSSN